MMTKGWKGAGTEYQSGSNSDNARYIFWKFELGLQAGQGEKFLVIFGRYSDHDLLRDWKVMSENKEIKD
jgi:hypothetical protein